MLDFIEFTLEAETIDLLLASVKALIASEETTIEQKIDLNHMVKGLSEYDEMRITFNPRRP